MSNLVPPQNESETRAQQDFDEFFSAVGYAITRWGHVDSALFEFCHFSLGLSHEMTAAIFYRSPNISDHLVLTDAMFEHTLTNKRKAAWKTIFEKTNELLPFRNELAHNPPSQVLHLNASVGAPNSDSPEPAVQFWQIQTDKYKALRKKGKHLLAKVEDIRSHVIQVNALLSLMWSFRLSLPRNRKVQKPKQPSPATLPKSGSKPKTPQNRKRKRHPV